jgi:DNA-binding CsgD family transcriptional regulator
MPPPELSTRELPIVELVEEGLPTTTIAARLTITPHTVNSHLEHVFRKLNVHRRLELVSRQRQPA